MFARLANTPPQRAVHRPPARPPEQPHRLQAKLVVGKSDDPLEREADNVADRVMRMPIDRAEISAAPRQVSRASCVGCEEDQTLRREAAGPDQTDEETAPPVVDRVLKSPGRPLDAAARAYFEPRFGQDFSKVRVHTDASAATSARHLHAHAFTAGNEIVFGPGRFAPQTPEGKSLLAHELTHVVQQAGATAASGVVQRAPDKPAVETKASFRDCTEATTINSNPQRALIQALDLAQRFVNGAIGKLEIDPELDPKGSSYPVALQRHFLGPSKPQRMGILTGFKSIYDKLKPGNIRCAANDQELETCAQDVGGVGQFGGFMRDGESVLCFNFWVMNPICKAKILIHEAAHAAGIGNDKTHPPYRGKADYPWGAGAPSKDQTAAIRAGNPDAYAYFAAHVWRDIDTECVLLDEIIDIRSTKDALPVTREKKEEGQK